MTSRSVLDAAIRDALLAVEESSTVFDEPMSRRTTLKIGGPADALVMPQTTRALQAVVKLCSEGNIPVTAIGGGSNLLVRDGGIRGVVVATRMLRNLARIGDTTVTCGAGLSTGKLLSSCTAWELGGLEFLGGVPGSVGGGLIMNAGTYLGEFKDVTRTVESVRIADGEVITRDNGECGFAYRYSRLPQSEIVTAATFDLFSRARSQIEAEVKALRKRRDEREPKKVSNSGSTFKNPPGDYAGRLIEASGLKGTQIGSALCSPVHANWMVNAGGATASELIELIDLVRDKVRDDHDVVLELEVKVIGEEL